MSKRIIKNATVEVIIKNVRGETLAIPLSDEGGEGLGVIWIDLVPYHVFVASRKDISAGGKTFIVDRDPNYCPRLNAEGHCVLIAPYSSAER